MKFASIFFLFFTNKNKQSASELAIVYTRACMDERAPKNGRFLFLVPRGTIIVT